MTLNRLLHFAPILKPTIWGGPRIAELKGISDAPAGIGESWEISSIPGMQSVVDAGRLAGVSLASLCENHPLEVLGERVVARHGRNFPLIVKFIAASDDLSIQVHPSDDIARQLGFPAGKSEMWYIVDCDPGAYILSGIKAPLTPAALETAIADGSFTALLNKFESSPGSVFYIPAGRIHAIGAGNLILEIQQASDTTLRIFDYNRLDHAGNRRRLHIAEARRAIDYNDTSLLNTRPDVDALNTPVPLLVNDLFSAFCINIDSARGGDVDIPLDHGRSFTFITTINGRATLSVPGTSERYDICAGDSILVPACVEALSASGCARIVTCRC